MHAGKKAEPRQHLQFDDSQRQRRICAVIGRADASVLRLGVVELKSSEAARRRGGSAQRSSGLSIKTTEAVSASTRNGRNKEKIRTRK